MLTINLTIKKNTSIGSKSKNYLYICNVIARRTKDLVGRITVNAVFFLSFCEKEYAVKKADFRIFAIENTGGPA